MYFYPNIYFYILLLNLVCPNGYSSHGENGELNLNNHKVGTWHKLPTIEECGIECNKENCLAFEYDLTSKLCSTHSKADKSRHTHPSHLVSCIKNGNKWNTGNLLILCLYV